jgi:hypothetical protein
VRVSRPKTPGRPKGPLPEATSLLTRRIRLVVNEAHLGNLAEAAAHTGLPYGTLRDLYLGRTLNPGIQTIAALAGSYGLSPGFFTDRHVEEVPLLAVETTLPPDPDYGRGSRGRRIQIPLAAWPLARLFLRLEAALAVRPPSRTRPILAGLTDREECRARLAAFLLDPLLQAREAGGQRLLGVEPPFPGTPEVTSGAWREWVETLRALGRFWTRTLEPLLSSLEREGHP